jgi:hypothetical protein
MALESALSPLIVLTPERPSVLVPIREKQANELLPEIRAQWPLFEKEASILVERTYFSKSPTARAIVRGSLIVFYVSRAEGGRGEVVGIARATNSGEGELSSMNSELFNRGVLDANDLSCGKDDKSKVRFFTFDSFVIFPKPVSFKCLKTSGHVGKANLISPQPLEFDRLLILLAQAGLVELE